MKNALMIIGGIAVVGGAYLLYKKFGEGKEEANAPASNPASRPNTAKVEVPKDLRKNMATASSAVLINKAPQMLAQPMSSVSALEQYGAPVVPVDSAVFINSPYFDSKARIVNVKNA